MTTSTKSEFFFASFDVIFYMEMFRGNEQYHSNKHNAIVKRIMIAFFHYICLIISFVSLIVLLFDILVIVSMLPFITCTLSLLCVVSTRGNDPLTEKQEKFVHKISAWKRSTAEKLKDARICR